MRLTVLGASGTYPGPGEACSGYLVRRDGFALWMDAGNGTLGRLQQHVAIEEVGAVFLSHVHPDHVADLYPFLYARAFHPERLAAVPVFAPPGARDHLARLLSEDARERFAEVFAWRDLAPGEAAEAGPFRLRAFESRHSAPNLTLRLEAGDRSLCYSGDTGPNADLPRAAEGVDLFLCESSWQDRDDAFAPIHLRAREAGDAARAAGAGTLVLTHVWPRHDPALSRSEAAERYDGRIGLAATETDWSL